MIDLYQLKYSFSAFLITSLIVFIGFLPWIRTRKGDSNPSHGLLERVCLSVVAAIVYLAIVGFCISLAPIHTRHTIALVAIAPMLIIGVVKAFVTNKCRNSKYEPTDMLFAGGFLVFSAALLVLASANFPLKSNLPDGAYVDKDHVASVKIQSITGNLPADNAIPYVVQEYLARDISFTHNSPILPGQHVANRPILVSLVTLPIRMALRSVKPEGDLPTYEYVGTNWPDFRILLRDKATFAIFLGVAVFLNATLLLALGLCASRIRSLTPSNAVLIILLFTTSPYFIFQTIFTWPKSLAGFFIISAAVAYQKYKKSAYLGGLLGLAYLSHPYAIGYLVACALALLLFETSSSIRTRLSKTVQVSLSFIITVLPWFIWTTFYLNGKSDLIAQNFSADTISIFQFSWPRIANLMNAILPVHLLPHDTHLAIVYTQSSLNLAGAVGILAFGCLAGGVMWFYATLFQTKAFPLPTQCDFELRNIILITGAASVLLACVFSNAAVPLLHGWQPFAALTILLCVRWASSSKLALTLCWVQVFVNIFMSAIYFYRRFLVDL